MKARFSAALLILLIVSTGSIALAKKEQYVAPVTQSGFPEATLPNTDIKTSKSWLMNSLADYGFFLSKEGDNILTFETEQKPMKFGQAMGMAFFESGVTNSLSNDRYLTRINCSLIPVSDTATRVILRTFEVTSPGTPAERVNEISKQAKSQQTYFQILASMEQKLNIKPVESITGQVVEKESAPESVNTSPLTKIEGP